MVNNSFPWSTAAWLTGTGNQKLNVRDALLNSNSSSKTMRLGGFVWSAPFMRRDHKKKNCWTMNGVGVSKTRLDCMESNERLLYRIISISVSSIRIKKNFVVIVNKTDQFVCVSLFYLTISSFQRILHVKSIASNIILNVNRKINIWIHNGTIINKIKIKKINCSFKFRSWRNTKPTYLWLNS